MQVAYIPDTNVIIFLIKKGFVVYSDVSIIPKDVMPIAIDSIFFSEFRPPFKQFYIKLRSNSKIIYIIITIKKH